MFFSSDLKNKQIDELTENTANERPESNQQITYLKENNVAFFRKAQTVASTYIDVLRSLL